MLDSSDPFTPAPATGRPLVSSGGQVSEHSLIFTHVSLLRGSREKRYSVKPDELTRILPSFVCASDTLAALAATAREPLASAIPAAPAAHSSSAANKSASRFIDTSKRWSTRLRDVIRFVRDAPASCGPDADKDA